MAEINPDGTGLRAFTKFHRHDVLNHAYGGAFTDDGRYYANFFPMANMTEAAGFGGIRRFNVRGMGNGVQNGIVTQIVGVGQGDLFNYLFNNPTSFGVFVPVDGYAGEPGFLSDGRLVYSWAPDIEQDYGLFVANEDGSGRTAIFDVPGRSELRASPLRARTRPPIIPDAVSTIASPIPPAENGPYAIDGTYTFDAKNVYFNAPVDTNVLHAPPVGSAATIGFFAAHQRSNPGSFENLDFPILIDQLPVNPDGSVVNLASPANMSLFEQIRDASGRIVQTASFRRANEGATHVAGMNYGRPGEVQACVGCHSGHSMIPIPADPQWTNLATGTSVTANGTNGSHLIDRRALTDPAPWSGNDATLTFPVPVTARALRLYGSGQVDVELLRAGAVVGTVSSGALQAGGTDVPFSTMVIDAFTLSLTGGTVTEVEMIASGDATCPSCGDVNTAPTVAITAPGNGTTVGDGAPVAFAGTAQDTEEGDLSPDLTWISDRDGVIGTGATFSTTLSIGTHGITASVTDAGGLSGEDVITVVVQSNSSPNVTIQSPADGSVVSAGTAVTFTGTAQDAEDGDLSAQLQWTSDRDGLLGNGAGFSTVLTVGTHLVTASVTDTAGLVGATVSTVTVGDGGGSTTVTLASIGTDDGRVVEETESSGTGGVVQSTAADLVALRMGDHSQDRQVKSILSFDTSAIPDGVPIISATVRLQRSALRGANPFNTHGDALVDVNQGAFGNNRVLQTGDFQAAATAAGVATLSDPVTNGGWSEGALDPDGLAALNRTGLTQLRVYFERDDNDDGSRDYVAFHSGDDANPATHPQLVVVYGLGGGGNTPPQVDISAPASGSAFGAGVPITFRGTAEDAEDGDLTADLAWSSDRDGTIGNGPTFSSVLSTGTHVVTASVVDSGLVLGASSVTVVVGSGDSSQDTFTSVAAHDGLVVEQSENSDTGGVVQSASGTLVALRIGDLSRDRQVKTIVSFDTSDIPDGATIISATLRLRRSALRGANPFNTHGAALVDVRQGAFGDDPVLQALDFQAPASAVGVATLSNPGATGDWSEGELGPDGLAAINRTGLTQLRGVLRDR